MFAHPAVLEESIWKEIIGGACSGAVGEQEEE
jgi:hypothetical protein